MDSILEMAIWMGAKVRVAVEFVRLSRLHLVAKEHTQIFFRLYQPHSRMKQKKICASGPHHQRSLDGVDSTDHNLYNGHNHELNITTHTTHNSVLALTPNSTSEELWLECKYETYHEISRKQFEDELKLNCGYTIPYLLFYQKVT